MRILIALAVVILIAAALLSPASGQDPNAPGFFVGLLQGAVSPFILMFGWLMNIRVYSVTNSGWMYDLGWMMGLLGFFYAVIRALGYERPE